VWKGNPLEARSLSRDSAQKHFAGHASCSFAYSALACLRTEMSGSVSFHSVRKSLQAVFALADR
jgi:hypothetical protein